jgi:peptide/nickel transport system permease protein
MHGWTPGSVMTDKPHLSVEESLEGLNSKSITFRSQTGKAFKKLISNKPALLGAIVLFMVIGTGIFSPLVAPYSPYEQYLGEVRKPPMTFLEGSSRFTILGTDHVGRDVLSRIVYASRVTLIVAFFAVIISGLIGLLIGVIAGYVGGWVDTFFMRLVDIVLAFPFVLLALSVVAVTGPGLGIIILVMSLRIWVIYARIVRGTTLSIKEKEFVQAAEALGATKRWIMFRHILPNVLTPVIVIATLYVGRMILIESALSFLGVGVPPPTPTWGGILGDGRAYIDTAWWIALFPGLAIMITVLGVNLVGDWLRDYLDPRIRL